MKGEKRVRVSKREREEGKDGRGRGGEKANEGIELTGSLALYIHASSPHRKVLARWNWRGYD